jgi:kynurenine formamidase
MALPTEDEVLGYFAALSNAGRWGDDDQAGTLNFLTDQKRVEAASLIKSGDAVSLAWEFDTSIKPGERIPPVRLMTAVGQGARTDDHDDKTTPQRRRQGFAHEVLSMAYHGVRITHIDSLAHHSWDGKLYNNYLVDATITPLEGARNLDVRPAQNILTRGILIDVPRHRGIDWMPEGDLLGPDELAEILAKEDIEVAEGDILFLRTGNGRHILQEGLAHATSVPGPGGFHVANMPFFHAAGVAAIGADMPNDRNKSEYLVIPNPVHAVGITAMGLWIIDNCNLEALSEAVQRHGSAQFAVSMSAIPFIGATGSPVNPTAIF